MLHAAELGERALQRGNRGRELSLREDVRDSPAKFFIIPMITLLRNAAMGSLRYKQELAEYKQQNIDVTNFEAKMEKFKNDFGRNYEIASRKFQTAIDEIDKTISHLQKNQGGVVVLREQSAPSQQEGGRSYHLASSRGNKTMKAAFDEARGLRQRNKR